MTTLDPEQLGKWRRRELSPSRLSRVLWGFWYNHVPRLSGWTISLPHLAFGVTRGLCLIAVTLAPVWVKFYDKSTTLSWSEALAYSSIISVLLLYAHVYDKIVRDYKPKTIGQHLKTRLSLELCGITRNLHVLVKLKTKDHQPKIDNVREKMLVGIRDAARFHLGDYEGTCLDASLLLFDDRECSRMKIVDRTMSSRGTGKTELSCDLMAFYVAKEAKHRVIQDFLYERHPFSKKGLSGEIPTYRSLLLIPLLDTSSEGPDTCIGVVALESTRPYHFWPGNGEDLVVQVQPYCSLLMFFLNLGEPHRLGCDSK